MNEAANANPESQTDLHWRDAMLDALPDSETVRRFISEYETVRIHEGRGNLDDDALRSLPWPASADPFAWEWYIRSQSFEHLRSQFLPRFLATRGDLPEFAHGGGLRILDLGAGVGWLSYRMALDGHRPVAVDLSGHPRVGLGAASAYTEALERPFPRWLAHFDHLPAADASADLLIYNASFHYSADYASTLNEALRCLAPLGAIVIMDTPIYRDAAAGAQMVEERKAAFEARYGFASSALESREFLTYAQVDALAETLDLRWANHRPKRGWSWTWHRLRRRWKTGRPSAEFAFLVATRSADVGA